MSIGMAVGDWVSSFVAHGGVRNAFIAWGVQVVVFNAAALLFAWLDRTGARGQWPGKWVWNYKVIRNDPVTWSLAIPTVWRNQVFILLPIMTLGAYLGLGFRPDAVVPLWMFPVHAYLLGVVHDVVFYFGHKLV